MLSLLFFVGVVGMVIGHSYVPADVVTHNVRVPVVHTHIVTNTVETPIPWNPHFKVCHNNADHHCLWIQGQAWWVK